MADRRLARLSGAGNIYCNIYRVVKRSRGSTGRRPSVLIVDDVEDNRRVYATFLRARAFDVTVAADGRQALAKARALLPDLVVMDLAIPGIDGWEVTRRLKRDRRTRRIPVIALTGYVLAGAREEAQQAGCSAFLTKPCLPDDLIRVIQQILKRTVTPNAEGRN
jgi:two-component system cell cycle response regulator DivK